MSEVASVSNSTDVEDAEANYFAMCLLMPEDFVRAEVAKIGWFDIEDDRAMKTLAKKFQVSVTMMTMRLGQLYFAGTMTRQTHPRAPNGDTA